MSGIDPTQQIEDIKNRAEADIDQVAHNAEAQIAAAGTSVVPDQPSVPPVTPDVPPALTTVDAGPTGTVGEGTIAVDTGTSNAAKDSVNTAPDTDTVKGFVTFSFTGKIGVTKEYAVQDVLTDLSQIRTFVTTCCPDATCTVEQDPSLTGVDAPVDGGVKLGEAPVNPAVPQA